MSQINIANFSWPGNLGVNVPQEGCLAKGAQFSLHFYLSHLSPMGSWKECRLPWDHPSLSLSLCGHFHKNRKKNKEIDPGFWVCVVLVCAYEFNTAWRQWICACVHRGEGKGRGGGLIYLSAKASSVFNKKQRGKGEGKKDNMLSEEMKRERERVG